MIDDIPILEAREADRQEEADRYHEWLDQQLIEEHTEHPERFHRLTPPPAAPTTRGVAQKGVD